LKSYQ